MRGREASAALEGVAVNEEKADPGDRETRSKDNITTKSLILAQDERWRQA